MGLQIWLPLKGNLENKGLSNITTTSSGITVNVNGKIGSCYTFDGNDYILINNAPNMTNWTDGVSICFWIKTTDVTSTQAIINHRTVVGEGLAVFLINNKVRMDVGQQIVFDYNYNFSNWTHVCLTASKNNIRRLYINGELQVESNTAYTFSLSKSGTIASIGMSTNNTSTPSLNAFNGDLNDFRLYDEALSPMQVKLISQGLVAHYLLNNNNGGMPNLLNGVPKFYGRTGYNPYQLDIINNLEVGKTYTIQFWNVDVSHTGKTASNLGISVYWGGGTINLIHFRGTDFFTNGHADYLTGTFTITSDQAGKTGATNAWLNIYNSVPSADGTKSLTIGSWKLEENSVPTPWSPYADDATNNIEYDVSGYCNNGTRYNITEYTNDTPRYSLATKFNGTNTYINVGRGGMVRDEITINVWAYMNDWSTYKARLISCTEGGGWNFEPSGSKIHVGMGTGVSSNTYKNTSGYALADLTSGWHMFTATYDGFSTKQYIDSNFNSSNNAYTTKTPIFYHVSNPIFIGAEASSGQNPAGNYFNGYLSDVRIYSTALSETDIQSLYNNSAFIDSSGNVYSTEYIEEQS